MRIFVGNLARDVTEAELQQAFAEFDQVSSVAILKDRETGEPRGFGFVEMSTDAEGKQALAGLAGRPLKGRALRVDEARPRDDRAPRDARPAFAGRSGGYDGRPAGAERDYSRPPIRTVDRPPDRGPERPADSPAGRTGSWGAERPPDRGADRDGVRRPAYGDRDSRSGPRNDWSPPSRPSGGDDWSPPGERDGDQPGRANRNSRATGKRKSDDPDSDVHADKNGRTGGRGGRARRSRFDDDEEAW